MARTARRDARSSVAATSFFLADPPVPAVWQHLLLNNAWTHPNPDMAAWQNGDHSIAKIATSSRKVSYH